MEATTAAPAIEPEAIKGRRLALLVLILGALTAFSSMSIDMYLPAFPQIARDLRVPLGTVQLTISAFLFGSASGQLFYGPIADRWGRRVPLLAGLSVYVLSAVGCACVHSGAELLFWRVVMALGGGAGMVISRAVVRDLYDTREAARMFSLLMLVMGASPILAPLAGGQVLLIAGWRGIFWLLTVFGILSLAATALYLPESLPVERRVRRGAKEMAKVYLHLLRNRRFIRYAIAIGFISGVIFAYLAGGPFVFIELHGISPQRFGYFFGMNAFGLIGASQVNVRLLRRFSAQSIMKAALGVLAIAGLILTAAGATGIGGFPAQVVLIFTCLCMTGFLFPNITALAMAPFEKAAGSASALLGAVQYTVGATVGAMVGFLHNGTAVPMMGMMAASAIMAWCAAVAATRAYPRH